MCWRSYSSRVRAVRSSLSSSIVAFTSDCSASTARRDWGEKEDEVEEEAIEEADGDDAAVCDLLPLLDSLFLLLRL